MYVAMDWQLPAKTLIKITLNPPVLKHFMLLYISQYTTLYIQYIALYTQYTTLYIQYTKQIYTISNTFLAYHLLRI